MKVKMDARGNNGGMSFADNWLEESCWESDDRKKANNLSEFSQIPWRTRTWTAGITHTNKIQGTFCTTDNVTPVSLYSAVHSVRYYRMYGTLRTHQRINENSLPTTTILTILFQKGNDVLQKAHQPLTIKQRKGGGEEWAKGSSNGQMSLQTNSTATTLHRIIFWPAAHKNRKRYIEWYNNLVPFYVRSHA